MSYKIQLFDSLGFIKFFDTLKETELINRVCIFSEPTMCGARARHVRGTAVTKQSPLRVSRGEGCKHH